MMRLARGASLVVLLLFPTVVVAAFEQCNCGTFTRAQCEAMTRAAVECGSLTKACEAVMRGDLEGIILESCRSHDVLWLSLAIAATVATLTSVRSALAPRRHWFARLCLIIVGLILWLGGVLGLILWFVGRPSHF